MRTIGVSAKGADARHQERRNIPQFLRWPLHTAAVLRFFTKSAAICALAISALPAWSDDLAAVRQALEAKYALTTTTADKSDIVKAGCILVLKKSNLVTSDASKTTMFGGNTYKNGRITQKLGIPTRGLGGFGKIDGTRTFVSGEKVWLTGIDVTEKDVVFNLFSDAISDVRYRASLKFPFEKDSTPTATGALAMVAEVFDIQADDTQGGGQQSQQGQQGAAPPAQKPGLPQQGQQAAPAAPAAAEAAPPPIAPPPPPPADPKEIKLGQTPDQVTANFGQPDKIIKLAAKQIYVYKDMKVVFVGGKVSDVQ